MGIFLVLQGKAICWLIDTRYYCRTEKCGPDYAFEGVSRSPPVLIALLTQPNEISNASLQLTYHNRYNCIDELDSQDFLPHGGGGRGPDSESYGKVPVQLDLKQTPSYWQAAALLVMVGLPEAHPA